MIGQEGASPEGTPDTLLSELVLDALSREQGRFFGFSGGMNAAIETAQTGSDIDLLTLAQHLQHLIREAEKEGRHDLANLARGALRSNSTNTRRT